ncbi:hypothetical protein [Mycolicibacterium llatzerense]|uniref:hypothetical protein n=1 Tax=Mycolicibacterium llatzerense TaxID=280871 RepID=UPI0008DE1BFE|nr:hypothetical protein [Mycolicibacterium llatzerense]
MTVKSVARGTLLLAAGIGTGIPLILIAWFALGFAEFPPGYAIYFGWLLGVVVWIAAAVPTYLRTRSSAGHIKWGAATFMIGVLAVPLTGAIGALVHGHG